MLPRYKNAIAAALGMSGCPGCPREISPLGWSGFHRKRYFFSTLVNDQKAWVPDVRELPWNEGWHSKGTDGMPSMTRSRGGAGGPLRASTYQYAARYLLYSDAWLGHSLAEATRLIAGLLPPGL